FQSGPGVKMPNFTIAGDAAESWTQPDETTYVFKLRPGIKYHNIAPVNGREMVADDVVQSFKRQIAEKFYASSLPNVDKLEAVDKSTVPITPSAPTADFLWSLGFCQTRIVPPETWAIRGDLKEGPIIGSGPVIFTGVDQWKQGDHCFLVRNPDYFIKG